MSVTSPDLQQQVVDLQAQVDQLEQLITDNITQNFITVLPDGSMIAEFNGIIVAAPGSSIAASLITGQLTAAQIAAVNAAAIAGQIVTTQITPGAITTALLAANSVTAAAIAAGAVTAGKISVATLSAIAANVGTLTAGEIDGVAIILPEGSTNTPTQPDAVEWRDGGNTVQEWIKGALVFGHHVISASAGGQVVSLIDDTGGSSFIRSTFGGEVAIAAGSGSFAGNGTSTVQTPVYHGLGRTPKFVSIFPGLTSSSTPWGSLTGQYQAADNTYFYAQGGGASFFSGITYFFDWLAIG